MAKVLFFEGVFRTILIPCLRRAREFCCHTWSKPLILATSEKFFSCDASVRIPASVRLFLKSERFENARSGRLPRRRPYSTVRADARAHLSPMPRKALRGGFHGAPAPASSLPAATHPSPPTRAPLGDGQASETHPSTESKTSSSGSISSVPSTTTSTSLSSRDLSSAPSTTTSTSQETEKSIPHRHSRQWRQGAWQSLSEDLGRHAEKALLEELPSSNAFSLLSEE